MGLIEPDVTEPVQNPLDRHPTLDPGERPTRTAVHTACERHVLPSVGSIDPQFGPDTRSAPGPCSQRQATA